MLITIINRTASSLSTDIGQLDIANTPGATLSKEISPEHTWQIEPSLKNLAAKGFISYKILDTDGGFEGNLTITDAGENRTNVTGTSGITVTTSDDTDIKLQTGTAGKVSIEGTGGLETINGPIKVGAAYNASNLIQLGSNKLWFDANNRLRTKLGTPISDTDGILISSGSFVNILDFGADPTGSLDSSTAVQAAINSVHPTGPYASRGTTVVVPFGEFKMSSTIFLERVTILQGVSGAGSSPGSRLIWDAGVPAIVVRNNNGAVGLGSTIRDLGIHSAGWSSLPAEWSASATLSVGTIRRAKKDGATSSSNRSLRRGVYWKVTTAGTTSGTEPTWGDSPGDTVSDGGVTWTGFRANGVDFNCQGIIERCHVFGFWGNGVQISANVIIDPSNEANFCELYNIFSQSNMGSGFYTDSGDANACTFVGCQGSSNYAAGFYESSFLGNTYSGCGAESNLLEPYYADENSGRNMFLGCYSESDQRPSRILAPSMVLGGLHGAGFTSDTNCHRNEGGVTNYQVFNASGGSDAPYVSIGSIDGTQTLLQLGNTHDAHQLYLRYGGAIGYPNMYNWSAGGLSGRESLMFAGEVGAKISSWPMQLDHNDILFKDGFFIGPNRITRSATIPTVGTYNSGDVIYNTTPVPGGSLGWSCTTSGTAGTYSEGRTATATGTITITLNSSSAVLRIGDLLTINSVVRNRIINIAGTTLTMASTVPTGSSLALSYTTPIFYEFGLISGA